MDKAIEAQRELVATRIMGWQPKEIGDKTFYFDKKNNPQSWDQNWSPDTDLTQAMQLTEALRSKGYDVRMDLTQRTELPPYDCIVTGRESDRPSASFNGPSAEGRGRTVEGWWYEHADTLAQAIFAVALQVAEQMERGSMSDCEKCPSYQAVIRSGCISTDCFLACGDAVLPLKDAAGTSKGGKELSEHECPSVFDQHWSKEAEFDKAVMEAERIESINGHAISTNPDNPIYAEIDRLRAELAKTHWLKEKAEKQLAEVIAALMKQTDTALTEQRKLAESQVEVQRLKEAVRRLNRGNWLLTKEVQVKEENQNVVIKNLQSALVAMGHEEDCPVVWAASAWPCVPGSGCVDYRAIAEKATAEAAELRVCIQVEQNVLKNKGSWKSARDNEMIARMEHFLTYSDLIAAHLRQDDRMKAALSAIRDYESAHGFYSEALNDMRRIAVEALAGKEGENA